MKTPINQGCPPPIQPDDSLAAISAIIDRWAEGTTLLSSEVEDLKAQLKARNEPPRGCALGSCPYCRECGLPDTTSFAERISLWLDEGRVIREGIDRESAKLVAELSECSGGLRELARRASLSPTYLSQVRRSNAALSPERFLSLMERLERAKKLRRHNSCSNATNRVAGGEA